MTTFILSGGYYYKVPDGGAAFCAEMMRHATHRPIRILDCLFGRTIEVDKKIEADRDFFKKFIPDSLVTVADPDRFVEQITENDIIFFQGSRPEDMKKVLAPISGWEQALEGKTVVASSGGASLLSAFFGTGKSTSGVPRTGEGLGILPIKFIPHWKSDHGTGFTADWDGLYSQLAKRGEALEIITLEDGAFTTIIL